MVDYFMLYSNVAVYLKKSKTNDTYRTLKLEVIYLYFF